jgi:hypothetical protein
MVVVGSSGDAVDVLCLFPAFLNQLEDLWQDQIHVREQVSPIIVPDLLEKVHDENWLDLDDLVHHGKDGVRELVHGFRDELDDHLEHIEKTLTQDVVVLLE